MFALDLGQKIQPGQFGKLLIGQNHRKRFSIKNFESLGSVLFRCDVVALRLQLGFQDRQDHLFVVNDEYFGPTRIGATRFA